MHFLVYLVCLVANLEFGAVAYPMIEKDYIDIEKNTIELDSDGQNEVFLIPKLKVGYKINVTGKMLQNREKLAVSLVTGNIKNPDYENVVCQFKADFLEDTTTINTVNNGLHTVKNEDLKPADLFTDSVFAVRFEIESHNKIGVHFGSSSSQHGCELQHKIEDVSYLILGKIEKVEQINFLLV